MEAMKAYLPDLIHARIDDLVNAQTIDEEVIAHMRELENRLEALRALAREEDFETAGLLAADVQQLCDRIRRDFVDMAYRQGLLDGGQLRELFLDQPPAERADHVD
jgi:hypothetical protein